MSTVPAGSRFAAVLALVALCAAACGGGSTSSNGGQQGGGGTPQHGGSVVIDRVSDSQSMDATTVFDNESIWILEQIMEPLYTVTPDGKSVKPWLATSYTESKDGKTYTFKLRPGVKFSTGKAMTSADVWTRERKRSRLSRSSRSSVRTALSSASATWAPSARIASIAGCARPSSR